MRKLFFSLVVLSALILVLAACGGGGDSGGNGGGGSDEGGGTTAGNAENGEKLYKQTTIGSASAPGCITCHSLEEGVVLVGPSHYGLATRAETAVAGMSAEEYLHQSIVDPDAHITEGFTAGIMYQNYGAELPEAQINDLVAFLMTQNQ
ncbi:MAG TPA: c-type cytochrome [Anaerolineae bacterium]|nr:c-type cytochrome [Anaerolineae bacterium]HIP70216.1 c-type cytochrome [Anaerolineae bacterium]